MLNLHYIFAAEGVHLSLRGVSIANNSYVDVDNIGVNDNALLCHTNKSTCCETPTAYRAGHWYFPNEMPVKILGSNPPENVFYRNRGPSIVRLNRRGNPSERGRFQCEVPDANTIIQRIFVDIGMLFNTANYYGE